VTTTDANSIYFQWKDNNPLSWYTVSYELWEVVQSTGMGYLRISGYGGTPGSVLSGNAPLFDVYNGKNSCLKVRAVNQAGYSMFSNISCGPGGSMPTYANVGLQNGVVLCSGSLNNCNIMPVENQSFFVAWTVCNAGNATSAALDVELNTNDNLGNLSSQGFPLSNGVAPGQCITQQSAPIVIGASQSGGWDWQVTINGVNEGSTNMTFFSN
jgi:hypothetical protein